MATWQKVQIQRECGEIVDAQAPLIVSASRSTDIPAFYADWFFDRLEKDILHGQILLMGLSPMFHTKRHDS